MREGTTFTRASIYAFQQSLVIKTGLEKNLIITFHLPASLIAGRIFKAIDALTQSVIVPLGQGEQLIIELCAIAKEFDLGVITSY